MWSATLLVAFTLVLLAALVAEPALSPARHVVSEYANSGYRWPITLGLGAWAVSLAIVAGALVRGPAVAFGLWLAIAGIVILALFRTQAVRAALPPGTVYSTQGRLHDLGGDLVLIGVLAAVAADAVRPEVRFRNARLGAAGLAVMGALVMLIAGDPAPGLRQRVTLAGAIAWQAILLSGMRRETEARARSEG